MADPIMRRGAWGYDVLARGACIGRVWKDSRHYDLPRPVTVHYWLAEPEGQRALATHFPTRREAVVALLNGAPLTRAVRGRHTP